MNVRLALPVLICLARAWTISGEFKKAMEVGQHEDRRTIRRRQGVDAADGGQRIAATGIGWCCSGRESASRWQCPRLPAASSAGGRAWQSRPGRRHARGK